MGRGLWEKHSNAPEPHRPAPAPWTAARCNRTLRQLRSFLSRLEKWQRNFQASQLAQGEHGAAAAAGAVDQCLGNATTSSTSANQYKTSSHVESVTATSHDDGHIWLNDAYVLGAKKRCNRTYGSRRTKAVQQVGTDETAQKRIRTTNLCARSRPPASPVCPQTPADPGHLLEGSSGYTGRAVRHLQRPRNRNICVLNENQPTFSFDLSLRACYPTHSYESIAVEAEIVTTKFFSATAESDGPAEWKGCRNLRERGAKSLLSICLSKAASETIQKQKENELLSDGYEGQVDVIGTLLEDLQDHFGDSRLGWSPLRIFTRMCGTEMISDAVRCGVLRSNVARELAARSFSSPVLSDLGEAITKSMVEVGPVTHRKSLQDKLFQCSEMPGMHALGEYRHGPNDNRRKEFKRSVVFIALRRTQNPLSLAWVGTDDVHFKQTVKHCARNGHTQAVALVEEAYTRALGVDLGCEPQIIDHLRSSPAPVRNMPRESEVQQLAKLSFLKESLSGLVNLSTEDQAPTLRAINDRICEKLWVSNELVGFEMLSRFQVTLAARLLLLDILLALLCNDTVKARTSNCLEVLIWPQELRKWIQVEMTCFLMEITTTAASDLATDIVRRILETLVSVQAQNPSVVDSFLARIAMDVAMEWALSANASGGPQWASRLQDLFRARIDSTLTIPPTPTMTQHKQGFRWDEGLDEWIAKTPATTAAKHAREGGTRRNEVGTRRRNGSAEQPLHWDGDFAYKKARLQGDHCIVVACPEGQVEPRKSKQKEVRRSRPSGYGDESEDDLSFLV